MNTNLPSEPFTRTKLRDSSKHLNIAIAWQNQFSLHYSTVRKCLFTHLLCIECVRTYGWFDSVCEINGCWFISRKCLKKVLLMSINRYVPPSHRVTPSFISSHKSCRPLVLANFLHQLWCWVKSLKYRNLKSKSQDFQTFWTRHWETLQPTLTRCKRKVSEQCVYHCSCETWYCFFTSHLNVVITHSFFIYLPDQYLRKCHITPVFCCKKST